SLGKPVLVMREVTERIESLISGTAKLVGTNKEKIIQEVTKLLTDHEYYKKMSLPSHFYGDGLASEKIANKLAEIAQTQFMLTSAVV
ncbi:MAG: UDP-N-acetylglucosamine 2-epimerase, partial [Proteobacteria bacterium]|nr:UDP-N-acetylglucosamine 2-epimerase [Pseudomonadota bacterium]